jgi:L-malate glycosyltransferase
MRIAYLTNSIVIHDYRFLSKISEAGHELFLFTFHDLDNPDLADYNPYIHNDVIESIKNIKGLTIVRYFPIRYFKNRFLKVLFLLFHLIAGPYLVRKKYNEYQCDLIDAGYVQRDGIVAALAGIENFMLTTWGSDVLILPNKNKILELLTRFTYKRAKLIYSDNEVVRSEVLRLCKIEKGKAVVFPQLGIDTNNFCPDRFSKETLRVLGCDKSDLVIVSTRNFEPVYNVLMLVDVINELRNLVNVSFKVVLIGSGTQLETIKKKIFGLGLEDYFVIPGYVPNDKLPSILASSDISVSTSLSDGTPLSMLEAMASGLPLVMTDIPSYYEWVSDGKNGFFVSLDSPRLMAEALAKLLESKELRKKMGELNRSIAVNRAEITNNYKKLEKCYSFVSGKESKIDLHNLL